MMKLYLSFHLVPKNVFGQRGVKEHLLLITPVLFVQFLFITANFRASDFGVALQLQIRHAKYQILFNINISVYRNFVFKININIIISIFLVIFTCFIENCPTFWRTSQIWNPLLQRKSYGHWKIHIFSCFLSTHTWEEPFHNITQKPS